MSREILQEQKKKESSFNLVFFFAPSKLLLALKEAWMKNKTAEIGPNSEFGARPKLYILSLFHSSFFWHPEKLEWNKKNKTEL
jgi:hypothetical protein